MFGSLGLSGRSVKGCVQLVLSQLLKFTIYCTLQDLNLELQINGVIGKNSFAGSVNQR